MQKELFKCGIEELEICLGFRPTQKLLAGWYARLKDFEDDTFRYAIHWLIETDAKVSFRNLKSFLIKSKIRQQRETEQRPVRQDYQSGGAAKKSDELRAMSAKYLGLLKKCLLIPDKSEREESLKELKTLWAADYVRLPGYLNHDQVSQLVTSENYPLMDDYNLLNPKFNPEKKMVKPFTTENSTAIEADYQAVEVENLDFNEIF